MSAPINTTCLVLTKAGSLVVGCLMPDNWWYGIDAETQKKFIIDDEIISWVPIDESMPWENAVDSKPIDTVIAELEGGGFVLVCFSSSFINPDTRRGGWMIIDDLHETSWRPSKSIVRYTSIPALW